MQRIGLAVIITLGLAFAPLAIEAQESGKIYRIGYLSSGTATANAGLRQAFADGLRDHLRCGARLWDLRTGKGRGY